MGTNLIALDVGEQRVGIALVRAEVSVVTTLPTLERTAETFWEQLAAILQAHAITTVVVGWPRNLRGEITPQTKAVEAFAQDLSKRLNVTIAWQDEALTSHEAERLLQASGQPYQKSDIDAQAARLILEDYVAGHALANEVKQS